MSTPSTPTYPVGAATDAYTTGGSNSWIVLMGVGLLLLMALFLPALRMARGQHRS